MKTEKQKTEEPATLYIVWFHESGAHDTKQVSAHGPHEAARRFVVSHVAKGPDDGRYSMTVVVAKKNTSCTTVVVEVEFNISTSRAPDGGQS